MQDKKDTLRFENEEQRTIKDHLVGNLSEHEHESIDLSDNSDDAEVTEKKPIKHQYVTVSKKRAKNYYKDKFTKLCFRYEDDWNYMVSEANLISNENMSNSLNYYINQAVEENKDFFNSNNFKLSDVKYLFLSRILYYLKKMAHNTFSSEPLCIKLDLELSYINCHLKRSRLSDPPKQLLSIIKDFFYDRFLDAIKLYLTQNFPDFSSAAHSIYRSNHDLQQDADFSYTPITALATLDTMDSFISLN